MKSRRFFQIFLSVVAIAGFVILTGPAWCGEITGDEAGIIRSQQGDTGEQEAVTPEKKTTERKSGYEAGPGSRFSSFPEYERYDASESYGSPYWGFMRDN